MRVKHGSIVQLADGRYGTVSYISDNIASISVHDKAWPFPVYETAFIQTLTVIPPLTVSQRYEEAPF